MRIIQTEHVGRVSDRTDGYREAVELDGERYVRAGYAIELLTDASNLSPLAAHGKLKRAAATARVHVHRLHRNLFLYRERDVLALRAELIEG